jgi:hypothetical protein
MASRKQAKNIKYHFLRLELGRDLFQNQNKYEGESQLTQVWKSKSATG